MASNRRIAGITIEIGGDTSKLQDALKGVDRQLRKTKTALSDVNKLLKLNPSNTVLLTQKQRYLSKAVEDTKARLNQLKDAQKGLSKGTEEYDRLQREIIETQNNLKKLTEEYNNFGSVSAQRIAAAGRKVQELGTKLKSAGQWMTTHFTLPITAGFTLAAKSASDYEENLNKIDVAFGKSAGEVREWSDNAMRQFGLSKVAATEATSSFGALAKGIGLSDTEAAKVSTSLAGLSADLGSYFNMSNEDSARALQGIFTGEAEALKRFGVVMTQTNLEAFAKKQGLVWKEASESEKVMIRYKYVLTQTKDAQGDYSRTSDGTSNSIKTFKSALQDLATVIGEKLLPIITPIVQKLTDIITGLSNLPEPVQTVIVHVGLLVAALGPVVVAISNVMIAAGKIMELVPKLVGAKGIGAVIKGVSGGGGLIATLGGLVKAAAPFLIGGAVVAGIIAAVVLIINNWDKIKKAAADVVKWVGDKWNELKTATGAAWDNIKQTVADKVMNLRNNIQTGLTNISTNAQNAWNAVKTSASNAWDSVRNKAQSVWNSIGNAMRSPIERARNFIGNAIDWIKQKFNFRWQLPHIKLPHFSWSWTKVGSWLSVPNVSVKWYKKAYENPMLFNSPTVLPSSTGLRGFGDGNGGEMVYGHDRLMRDIRNAVGAEAPAVNITVNAAEGQNPRQIAEEVQRIIIQQAKQRSAAFA